MWHEGTAPRSQRAMLTAELNTEASDSYSPAQRLVSALLARSNFSICLVSLSTTCFSFLLPSRDPASSQTTSLLLRGTPGGPRHSISAHPARENPGLIPGRGRTCSTWEWERHQVQELKTKQGITVIISISMETIKKKKILTSLSAFRYHSNRL